MDPVPVLVLDPDLAGGIAEPRLSAAVRACRARVLELQPGPWQADDLDGDAAGFGLLLLSGILCRRVVQHRSCGAELIGPGDLLRPGDTIGEWGSIPTEATWTVIETARLAVLDRSFTRRAGPYPEVAVQLLRRGLMRSRNLAIVAAIISQRRIETRLTMLLWHLADRFGHVRGSCVDVPVPLTHEILAEMIAARRPSVTTALSRLQRSGAVQRQPWGWRLRGTAPEIAAPTAATHGVPAT